MTGMYEQVRPGIGHNQPDEYAEEKKHQKWERWAKKRTFVRALEGTYSHLYKALLEEKRVYPSRDVPWKGGPGQFGKSVISPQATSIIQSMESHIEAYAPGAYGQKHGHLNSAVFYVLKGRGLAEFPRAIRNAHERRQSRGHALGAFRRRFDQAPRPSSPGHARMLRRSLHAVPQGRRALGQAPAHVGGDRLRGRRIRLRPALGHAVRLPRCLQVGVGRGAEEVRVERGRLHLHPTVHHASALRDRGDAAHHDEQPHGQGDGLRLVRPGREGPGIRAQQSVGAVRPTEPADAG